MCLNFSPLILNSLNIYCSDPAAIQKITELVMVDEGGNAYLECNVDSNPTTDNTITWRRRRNETDGSSTPIDSLRMRSTVESVDGNSNGNTEIKLKSTLVIYNATLEDSGASFDCVANNGIGETDTSTAVVLVLREY
jgi:hypothetical protein